MFDLAPGKVLLNPLPQFHVGGSIFGALSGVAAGWTVVIPTPLGARNPNVVRDWWSIVERNKVTIAGAVPTSLAAIMNVPRDGHDLSSLKVFLSGGSTVPVELIRRIEREIGVPVVEGYGMTEVHCYSTMNPMHGERRPGSVGLRLPYTEVRIADVAGDGTIRGDCPLGTIGHVLMRGPQVTPGYLDPRHDMGAMLADGWLELGRSRPARRRRLCLAHRTLEGPDHPRRPQHRPDRDRGGAGPPSRGRDRGRSRPARHLCRRAADGVRAAQAQRDGDAGGAARILPPGNPRARRRAGAGRADPDHAAHRRGQDLQAGAAARGGAARVRRGADAAARRWGDSRCDRGQRSDPRHVGDGADQTDHPARRP